MPDMTRDEWDPKEMYHIGELVKFSEKAPLRWSKELRHSGKVYPASDVCKVIGFSWTPGYVRVVQEGRKSSITLHHSFITKREREVSDATRVFAK